MESLEYNTAIGRVIINEYDIKDFEIVYLIIYNAFHSILLDLQMF